MTSQSVAKPIVVGIDGSEADQKVLRWAVREAQRRGSELLIVHAHAVVTPSPVSEANVVSGLTESADFCDELLADAMHAAASVRPQVAARTLLRWERPAEVLVDLSADASMVVLGTHGDGRFVGALLGSVSQRVAAHARCPVVVLPAEATAVEHSAASTDSVLVGVSRSAGGSSALHFAFSEAQLRQVELVAVRSWTEPAVYGIGSAGIGYVVAPPLDTLRQCEQTILDECLAPVQHDFPDVKVRSILSESSADRVLTDCAREAGLLVVGCRHEDGHRLSRLGPIGSWLLHNSSAPIAVVGFAGTS
jgi:nucleotide-binding universal stress UspA family protein